MGTVKIETYNFKKNSTPVRISKTNKFLATGGWQNRDNPYRDPYDGASGRSGSRGYSSQREVRERD